jgi:hypothetical protein
MKYNNATLGKCAIVRKTAEYVSVKLCIFIEF